MSSSTNPSIATNEEPLVGLYTMFFRSKDNNHLQNKNFRYHGSLHQARARAEKHCEVLGLRLMFVQPLISNLQDEEDHFFGLSERKVASAVKPTETSTAI